VQYGANPIKEILFFILASSLKLIDSVLPQLRSNYRIVTIGIEVTHHQEI